MVLIRILRVMLALLVMKTRSSTLTLRCKIEWILKMEDFDLEKTTVRRMRVCDIPPAFDIDYRRGLDTSELHMHKFLARVNQFGQVIEDGGLVVGYMLYKATINASASRYDVKVMHFATEPWLDRLGVAKKLIGELLKVNGLDRRVIVDVPEDRLDVQMLLKSLGFKFTMFVKTDGEVQYRMVCLKKAEVPSEGVLEGKGR